MRENQDPVDKQDKDLVMCNSGEHKCGNKSSKQKIRRRKLTELNRNPQKEPAAADQNGIRGFSGTYDLNGVTKILILMAV